MTSKTEATLTTLAPLHIGTGESFTKHAYLISGGYVYIIDPQDVFKYLIVNGDFPDGVLKEYSNMPLSKFIHKHSIDESEILKKARHKIKRPDQLGNNAKILECIKLPLNKRPYVPGSSLKGALRTAILWNNYKVNEGNVDEIMNCIERYEESTLGSTIDSIMKCFHVSDTYESQHESSIYKILISSPNNELKWKKYGLPNTYIIAQASPTYCECIEQCKEFTLYIDLPEFSSNLRDRLNRPELKDKRDIITLQNIIIASNTFSKYQIEADISYIKKYSSLLEHPIVNFYKELAEKLNAIKPNECILHMSWGAGWLSKTFTSHEKDKNKEFFNANKEEFGDRKRLDADIFPKTRRFVMQGNDCIGTLGWIKLTFPEIVGLKNNDQIINLKGFDIINTEKPVKEKTSGFTIQIPTNPVAPQITRGSVLDAEIVKIENGMATVKTDINMQKITGIRLPVGHTYNKGAKVMIKVKTILNGKIHKCRIAERTL